MDNGFVYPPSEYALRFGKRADQPATNQAVVAELKRDHANWPRLVGLVYGHREACMLAALWALDAALEETHVTKQGLRRRMVAALAAIAERGPEAVEPNLPTR